MDDMINNLTEEEFNTVCKMYDVVCNYSNKECLKSAIIAKINLEEYKAFIQLIEYLSLEQEIIRQILQNIIEDEDIENIMDIINSNFNSDFNR